MAEKVTTKEEVGEPLNSVEEVNQESEEEEKEEESTEIKIGGGNGDSGGEETRAEKRGAAANDESGSDSDDSEEEDEEEEEEEEGEKKSIAEAAGGSSRMTSKEEKMARFRELHRRRLEARQLNHREVVEEDKRNKLPANWEARQRKIEWEEEDEKARKPPLCSHARLAGGSRHLCLHWTYKVQAHLSAMVTAEAEAAGEDYEKEKLLQTSAAELDRQLRKKRKNPDPGFSDYAQAQFRQYDRLTKQIKPDLEAYEKMKYEMGSDFYPGVNTLSHGGVGRVTKEGVERVTQDLAKQVEKRLKYSRRRPHDDDKDIDYINDRNKRFNQKAARFYDKYTAEIKQNLERGTAI